MPTQHQDRMGLLVIRASVEHDRQRRLVVQVIEVNSTRPDRVIGAVSSSKAAARLVVEWLDSLELPVCGDASLMGT